VHRRLFAFPLLIFVCASSSVAQAPPGFAPPTPVTPPVVPTTPGSQIPNLYFPNTPVQDVLSYYERLTHKRLVADNTVQGPVNIVVNTPVTADEAIKIIETNLLLNGYSLIPGEGNIVKVVGLSKNPRSTGVPIYSDIEQISTGERIVTFVFKLQYVDPQEMAQILQGGQLIAPSLYTGIVALPKSQTLLVTENTAVLRNIAKVIRDVDVPPAEVISEFIQLERADAKDVIEKLEKIFEKTQGQGGSTQPAVVRGNSIENPPVPGGAPNAQSVTIGGSATGAAGLSEESIIVGKIKLTADIRTNRIHVITRPINLPFVRRLIHEFDSNIQFGQPVKRPLKYVSASDMLDVVVKAITEPGVKADEATSGTGTSSRTGAGATNPNTNPAATSFGGSSSSGSSSDSTISEGLSTQPVDTTPKAVTIGSTKIIADPRENTIIVLGNQEVRQKIFTLLDQLDVRAPQVMLNTVIGELTLNNDEDTGIDLLNLVTSPSALASSGTSAAAAGSLVTTAASAFTSHGASLATNSGLTQIGVATKSLEATIQLLEATGRFRVTNRPMIFTSNNKKAIIVSGSEIAVPTQTLSNVVNGATAINNTAAVQSSVEFKKVALQLEVVPLINSEREVALDILQKLDSLSGQSTNVGGNQIPTIQTRYLRSNVSVPNRSTIVLGGLITRTVSNTSSGLPVLSRVPVLGYFFKKNSKKMDRSELIVLIRPVVTARPAETVENSHVERERLMVNPDIEDAISEPAPLPHPVKFRYDDFKETR
jgi:general secretion pathway protein D